MDVTDSQRLKNRKPIPKPVPAYLPVAGTALTVDKDLYNSIREAPRVLIEEFTLPIRSGKAWKAPAGSIVRISTPEGPQVGMHCRLRGDVRLRWGVYGDGDKCDGVEDE